MSAILIYITTKTLEESSNITSSLLDKKLIAGVNVIPSSSAFWLKGKISTQNDFISILKTRSENWDIVRDEIKRLHPDDSPEIIKMNVESNVCFDTRIYDVTIDARK